MSEWMDGAAWRGAAGVGRAPHVTRCNGAEPKRRRPWGPLAPDPPFHARGGRLGLLIIDGAGAAAEEEGWNCIAPGQKVMRGEGVARAALPFQPCNRDRIVATTNLASVLHVGYCAHYQPLLNFSCKASHLQTLV